MSLYGRLGTGVTPTHAEIAEVHAHAREMLKRLLGPTFGDQIRLLYGGSVSPANAKRFLSWRMWMARLWAAPR